MEMSSCTEVDMLPNWVSFIYCPPDSCRGSRPTLRAVTHLPRKEAARPTHISEFIILYMKVLSHPFGWYRGSRPFLTSHIAVSSSRKICGKRGRVHARYRDASLLSSMLRPLIWKEGTGKTTPIHVGIPHPTGRRAFPLMMICIRSSFTQLCLQFCPKISEIDSAFVARQLGVSATWVSAIGACQVVLCINLFQFFLSCTDAFGADTVGTMNFWFSLFFSPLGFAIPIRLRTCVNLMKDRCRLGCLGRQVVIRPEVF
jgi:hypothetical protein